VCVCVRVCVWFGFHVSTKIGMESLMLRASRIPSIANNAALQFKVSKIVSTSNMSTPPSSNALTCSAYDSTSSSNAAVRYTHMTGIVHCVRQLLRQEQYNIGALELYILTLRARGLSTEATLAVRFVGPTDPATYRGFVGSLAVQRAAASLAISAAFLLSSYTCTTR
jgi:hypothetical protein